jgi:hypothetical protein
MINFEEASNLQMLGAAEIKKLSESELDMLKYFCLSGAQAWMKIGAQQKSSVEDVVLNAYRMGIALGSQLSITNGEIKRRF